ncbi:MAG TPA: hypothetical protein VFN82_08440 [Solirubrobacterales bacterium]|nr:hypothetical protein [Solirubrobacterales bacterium]
MTLPLAHVGHYLWILYLVPVLIVVGAIIRNAIVQRHLQREEEEEGEGEER